MDPKSVKKGFFQPLWGLGTQTLLSKPEPIQAPTVSSSDKTVAKPRVLQGRIDPTQKTANY